MLLKITETFLIIYLMLMAANFCPAQKPPKSVLPRIGFLREDQKNGGKEGCGNHVLYPNQSLHRMLFQSDDEGFNARMNLNGKNAELRLIKTTLFHRDALRAEAIYEYRYKNIRVIIELPQLADYVFYFPAKITVRKFRASQTIKAVVAPQCD